MNPATAPIIGWAIASASVAGGRCPGVSPLRRQRAQVQVQHREVAHEVLVAQRVPAGTLVIRRERIADGDPDPITVPLARADADVSITAVRHGEPVGTKD